MSQNIMDKPLQQFRIAEIEVSKGNANDKIVGLFRFEGQPRAKQSPLLVIIAEITSTVYSYERLLDTLTQTAEQTRALMSGVEQDPLTRFEKLIQRLNESMAAFNASESAPVSWKRINLYIMELSEGHICLSGTGHVMNMFLQKQAEGGFRAFDLFGSLEQPEIIDQNKPFSSIICGDVKAGDVLFVGSGNFERLHSELKVKERLTTLPPVTAALEIRQDLERRNIPDDFLAAVIACVESKSPAPVLPPIAEPARETSTSSIERLREQEKTTDEHLGPAPAPTKELAALKDKALDFLKRFKLPSSPPSLSPAQPSATIKDRVTLAGLRGMNAGHGRAFTQKHKTIAIAAVIGVIFLIGGYSYWKHTQKIAAEIAAWNAQYDAATDQRNRAESDLVYGNEPKAKTELAAAEQGVTSLGSDTPERKARIEKLQNEIKDLKERLKRVVKVDNAAEIVSLPASAATGSLAAPVLDKDTAYVVDNDSKQVLETNLTTKTTKQIPLPAGASRVIAGTVGKDNILFTTEDGKLYGLNKSTGLVKALKLTGASSSTADGVLYAAKLYTLDPSAGKIVRYTANGSDFGSASSYIKAGNSTLNDSVALAIDSNVYVLKSNGSLIQYFQGAEAGFSLAPIDPPARSASGLWTDIDIPVLAITDPADRRVLLYDKSGALRAQLTSSQFIAPKDLSGDYANKRLIVIDGNRLLLVTMP